MEDTVDVDASQEIAAARAPEAALGHVFISYARADTPQANQVERMCSFWGCRTWMDQRRLGGGQDWTAALERAIDESQALVLILTPAALASPVVRREYLRALGKGLPVLLIRFRQVDALPPELAQAPLINFEDRLHAGPSLYFALADLGLAPPPPADRLETVTGYATFAELAGRTPPDWRVYRVSMGAYWRRTLLTTAPLLTGLAVVPYIAQTLAPRDAPLDLATQFTVLVVVFASLASFLALRNVVYGWILLRWLQPEMVIAEPEACTICVIEYKRGRLNALPRRYVYRWATSARVSQGAWGATRVIFTDSVHGEMASALLPRLLPDRLAIAQRIAADVAAYHARQGRLLEDIAPTPVAPALDGPASGAPLARTVYCALAPREYSSIIASIGDWLGRRAIPLAESRWVSEGGETLLPTAQGALSSRFALFVDVPAITQSPRCQAILTSLRRQGTLLIPLRVTAQPPEPGEWSSTQWVDFSPLVARERGLSSLCDALDRAGVPLAVRHGDFDAELALARAIYQRTPPDWSVSIADPGMERALQRVRRISAIVYAASLIGLALLLGTATAQAFATLPPGSPEYGYLALGAVTTALLLGVFAIPLWRQIPRHLRLARLHAGILRERQLPQCLVVTPEGIAFHLVSPKGFGLRWRRLNSSAPFEAQREFLAGGVAFSELLAVTGRRGLFGAPSLRLTARGSRVIDLPLLAFPSSSDAAIALAAEAFAAFRARAGR